jgi:SAM-dependent methyltransferase
MNSENQPNSIIFSWNKTDLQSLLETCETDGVFPYIQKYIPKTSYILESGCGSGRYVRYLQDRGWNIVGLEWSQETVQIINDVWPDLKIYQGDVANSLFEDETFDAVISLGVIEHFPEGPDLPLHDIYRILKPGGVALITVPCLNTIRKIKRAIWWNEMIEIPRMVYRTYIKKTPISLNRFNRHYKYSVSPAYGFYEYHMTHPEFASEIENTGFEVLEHFDFGQIDGIYHELNLFNSFIKYRDHKFIAGRAAQKLCSILSQKPYFVSHLMGVLAKKTTTIHS